MTITTMDQLVAGLTGGYRISFDKVAAAGTQPCLTSYWTLAGSPGAANVPPTGAGEVPTNATAGALAFVNPSSGQAYLAGARASGPGAVLIYDRLVHTSGLSAIVTTAQTVDSVAVNRPDTTGYNTQMFLEVYTALGSSASAVTISYTNQSGTAGQTTTVNMGSISTNQVELLLPLPLAQGDSGVQSVQTVTLNNTTGTAGNFGITIARLVAVIPGPSISPALGVADPFALGLPEIENNACLWPVGWGNAAAIAGQLLVAQL